MPDTIVVEKNPPIATLTLNRPDRLNAINEVMLQELHTAITDVDNDLSIRGIILRGEGKSFCAGADLEEMKDSTPAEAQERSEIAAKITTILEHSSCVTVAAIHGHCVGGGHEIALACDFRIATPNAKLGQPELRVGLVPGYGGTVRLPRLVGLARARSLLLSGESLNAEDAEKIGLVDKVVKEDMLMETAHDFVQDIMKTSPLAYKRTKHLLHDTLGLSIEDALKKERDLFSTMFGTHDQKEGAKAFLEKREPEFRGE